MICYTRVDSPSKKRTKKDKHKKKRTKRDSLELDLPAVKPLTLKIRLGNEVVTAETSDVASVEDDVINVADVSSNSIKSGSAAKQNSDDWGGTTDTVYNFLKDKFEIIFFLFVA